LANDPSRQALLAEIATIATLHGRFRLRSGTTASTYFDKYLFEGQPGMLRSLGALMATLLPTGTAALAGLELGGIPFGLRPVPIQSALRDRRLLSPQLEPNLGARPVPGGGIVLVAKRCPVDHIWTLNQL
jgi:hypothetical protein